MNSTISVGYSAVHQLGLQPYPALTNKAVLAVSDLLGFLVAFFVPTMLHSIVDFHLSARAGGLVSHGGTLIYVALTCAGSVWFWNRLRHYTCRKPPLRELLEVFQTLIVLAIIDVALTALSGDEVSPERWALTWGSAMVVVPVLRSFIKRVLGRAKLWRRAALIVGCGENALEARRALEAQSFLGVDVIAYVVPENNREAVLVSDAPILHGITPETLRSLPGVQVVIAIDQQHSDLRDAWLRGLTQNGIREVTVMASMRGVPLSGTDISYFFGHEVMMLRIQNNLARFSAKVLKRIFDVVAAGFLVFMMLPLFVILIWMITRDGGAAFFGHTRIGQSGREFKCYKFRSMVPDAERVLNDLLLRDPEARAEWQTNFKLKNDIRITSIGRFLRKTSLDELPQLWNVLSGSMSLVGPRPVVEKELERYGEDVAYYLLAKPGMTGLWQVSGRNDTDYAKRVFLDAWYARNWSLSCDMAILFKTVGVVLRQDGAY